MIRFLKKIIPAPLFRLTQPVYHYLLSLAAGIFYGFPGNSVVIIGVTGTNGKSTVVEMLHEIFSAAGYNVASLSSIRFKIGDEVVLNQFKMTMPGRFFVQQFLSKSRKKGITHVILEVTSEGIKQFRHKHILFSAAVITNLTPEHIESHGGFEKYKRAKGKLFRALGASGIAIVNAADPHAEYFLSFPAAKKYAYSLKQEFMGLVPVKPAGADEVVAPEHYEVGVDEIRLMFEKWEAAAPLRGRFNAENMMAAVTTALAFGVPTKKIQKGFQEFKGVPGRMEEIQKIPFRVIVDYAFTPNALRQVYETLKKEHARLICVLGAAGGGRDRWKRQELGNIAGEYCAEVIITNEDPYEEDPRSIMEDVKKGTEPRTQLAKIIEDRREAIREALKNARAGDAVIVTGKGSESAIAVRGGKTIPWDDRAVAREELQALWNAKRGINPVETEAE